MTTEVVPSEYRAEFLGRVKAAREVHFANQTQIAVAMGMKQSSYSKYETRSLLPHWLIDRFCAICHVSPEWLVTGRGAGPKWQPVYPSGKTRNRTHKRRKAA